MRFQIYLLILLLNVGCKKDSIREADSSSNNSVLTVVTGPPSNITYYSAEFSAGITSPGPDPITDIGICWDNSPGPTTSKNLISGAGVLNFTATITNLTHDRLYYVRAYATSASGTVYGEEWHFEAPGHWIATHNDLQAKITTICSTGYGILAGTENNGVFLLNEGTQEWTAEKLNVKNIRALMLSVDPFMVYAATPQGIFYKYSNTWTEDNSGLDNLNTTALAISSEQLFTLAGGNVYRQNTARQWIKLSYSGVITNIWQTKQSIIAYDKTSGLLLHISPDGEIKNSSPSPSSNVLAISEFKDVVYLGAADGAYISLDKGLTWNKVEDSNIGGHSVKDFAEDKTGLCAIVENDVYKVRPSGTWLRVCPGIPQNTSQIQKICFGAPLYVCMINELSSKLYWLD